MRDAFGGVFMIRLFLVFIFIYVAFSAISLNYAKAFKIKNKVIDLVETNEVISLTDAKFYQYKEKLEEIIVNSNYNSKCENYGINDGEQKSAEGDVTGYCHKGIYIKKIGEESQSGSNASIITYQVSVSAEWNLGILNKILVLGGKRENSEDRITGNWVIVGEAKVVSKG